jgi:uncharacterized repeat protein (TIGR03943 family)
VTAAGGAISLLLGTVLLRLTFTGMYRRYVRVGMGPWLAIAGVAILILGAVTLWRALRTDRAADPSAGDHDHHDDLRIGWLLLAPIAALLLVAPPTLGSFGIDRGGVVDVRPGASVFEPLIPGEEPTSMSLLEFGQRAVDHAGASFNGATVRLTGFVAAVEGDGFLLARYQIACCAADAAPVVVRVTGVYGDAPPRDRWVTVTGSHAPSDQGAPSIAATSVALIPTPDDPYE